MISPLFAAAVCMVAVLLSGKHTSRKSVYNWIAVIMRHLIMMTYLAMLSRCFEGLWPYP